MPVIYIDKPKGITSFALCNKLKPLLNTKKIGHTGTLDPNATGLMIVLYDEATKANQFLLSDIKEYIGVCKIGVETSTLDIDGDIIRSERLKMPSKVEIEETFKSFVGFYEQIPPMTSAVKVNGKKLYEYQRKGIDVVVKPRKVQILKLELLDINEEEFKFKCLVSSGTYVRSLLKDILDKLSIYGTLKDLRRTKINNIDISLANTLDDVINNNYVTYSLYDVLKDRYNIYVTDNSKAIKDGKKLVVDLDYNELLIVDKNNNCLAIYAKDDNCYRCVRGLF